MADVYPLFQDYEHKGRRFRTVMVMNGGATVVPLRDSFQGFDFRCVQFHRPNFGLSINIQGSVSPTPIANGNLVFIGEPFRELAAIVQSGDGPRILDLDNLPITSFFPPSVGEDLGATLIDLDCFSEIRMVLTADEGDPRIQLTLAEKR